jgi:1-acyl-sn-glycerol-3-phosphate acyltransferase
LIAAVGRHARAAARFTTFLVVSLVFAIGYVLTMPLPRRAQQRVQRRWCAAVAWAAGLDVRVTGTPVASAGPTLFLVNHVSYFDIPAFGALVDATFVAKSEVASWPLFGQFSRLTSTVFIPRHPRRSAEQVRLLRARLDRGESLILFPEGTNSDGTAVLAFKSSLLEAAVATPGCPAVAVQPVSLAYTRLRTGAPLTGARADLFAWVGFDDMLPHLWRALGSAGAEVLIRFHPPLPASVAADRKSLGRAAEAAVRAGLSEIWTEVEDLAP